MNYLVPFKSNCNINQKGSNMWSKSFHFFQYKKDEFMSRYHKRSNVETVFQMIKNKFGANLLTKNNIANTNEILVKVLCHNLCVLISEMFELGISVDFFEIIKSWEKTNEEVRV